MSLFQGGRVFFVFSLYTLTAGYGGYKMFAVPRSHSRFVFHFKVLSLRLFFQNGNRWS